MTPDEIDRSYALSLAEAVENCRVTCKHEPSAFDLEQQGYKAIITALRAWATRPEGTAIKVMRYSLQEFGYQDRALSEGLDLAGEIERRIIEQSKPQPRLSEEP